MASPVAKFVVAGTADIESVEELATTWSKRNTVVQVFEQSVLVTCGEDEAGSDAFLAKVRGVLAVCRLGDCRRNDSV